MIERAIIERNSMPVTECGCWWWLKTTNHKGYGVLSLGGSSVKAHRLSWIVHRGPIPQGLFVLHRCDTPCCVNPDHLFLGTHQDNMDDATAKGRYGRVRKPKPTKSPRPRRAPKPHSPESMLRKLTAEQIEEIARSGRRQTVELAARFGVHISSIARARNRALGRQTNRR